MVSFNTTVRQMFQWPKCLS